MNEKNNKKKVINMLVLTTIFAILIGLNYSMIGVAHPASEMSLSYDKNTNILEVKITHQVSDAESHYIDNVTISINDEKYETYEYFSQPTSSSFTYNYNLSLSEGDKVEVYTHCNLGGDLTEELTVTKDSNKSSDKPFSLEGLVYYSILGLPFIVHLGIITLFVFILTAALALLKRKGKIRYPLKLHIWLAYLGIILAIIHGILGLFIYV